MSRPRIVCDDAIPWLCEAFESLGTVVPMPGRSIDARAVADANILITRSVTRVDAALVHGSALELVASATAGVDHVDRAALAQRGIAFAHAPGSNARAVVEYVVTAVLQVASTNEPTWLTRGPIGVVGFGHVGRRLTRLLRALGLQVTVSDPALQVRLAAGETDPGYEDEPHLQEMPETEPFVALDQLLATCPIVTLHVPLVREGPFPTHHLLTAARLDALPARALVVNTSRGGVIDDAALLCWLADRAGQAVLDVWEHEPQLCWELLEQAGLHLATPHIAGYTVQGKARATAMVHAAICRHLGRTPFFDLDRISGGSPREPVHLDRSVARSDLGILANLLGRIEELDTPDRALRSLLHRPISERPTIFEDLRRGYRLRRELTSFAVMAPESAEIAALPRPLQTTLTVLGLL